MGPSLDLVLRRTHLASDDLMKAATKVPRVVKVSTRQVSQRQGLRAVIKIQQQAIVAGSCNEDGQQHKF